MTRQSNIGRGLLELREVYTKKELVDLLKEIRGMEKTARDNYKSDVHTFKNENIKKTIEYIKEEEDRHIEILETLIINLGGKL